jgi:hypothetical protein
MSASIYEELVDLDAAQPSAAVLDRLVDRLRNEKRYHKLFDALCLRRKAELGLPLFRPASLADVPRELRGKMEETYAAAAREVGQLFLDTGDIPSAWMYFQVIKEHEPVRAAIDRLPVPDQSTPESEPIIRIALYEGVHPERGLQWMLKLHGTCSTITSLDQASRNLAGPQRQACAAVLVRSLASDLRENVERQVRNKLAMLPPGQSLRELMAGRDWLFAGGNYHIDVSHLNSVVRFARSLESPADLELALQLAEYGAQLDPQLQYADEPPFEEFYAAHVQFFRALLNRDRPAAIGYFRDMLEREPDERDRPLLAYVLVDLLMRCGQLDDAVELAGKYLAGVSEEVTVSFVDLCRKAGRMDSLRAAMKAHDDPVLFAAALVEQHRSADSAG